jgi:hypothetical protein
MALEMFWYTREGRLVCRWIYSSERNLPQSVSELNGLEPLRNLSSITQIANSPAAMPARDVSVA